MSWVSWDTMTKSKKDGGLGFRDIQAFNDALLAKLSWRIMDNPSCLLARVLKGKYFQDQEFLQATTPASCSHGWRGIMIGSDLIKEQLGWAIGNGKNVSGWNDDWLSTVGPERPVGPAPEVETNLRVSDLMSSETKDWDRQKIERSFPLLLGNILSIKPSKKGGEDKLIWLKHKSGAYTTKTRYYSAREKHQQQLDNNSEATITQEWLNEVWKITTAPKLKLFIWKIKHGALPVGDRLEARHILTGAKCTHCGSDETITHLFFQCPFALRVWELVPFSGGFAPLSQNSFNEEWQRLLQLTVLPPVGLGRCPLAPWIIWSIWSARNQKIFQQRSFTAQETILKAMVDAKEWQDAQSFELPLILRKPHPQDTLAVEITCRSDAAWKKETHTAGMAWSFSRNQSERISSHSQSSAFVISSIMAEGLAMLAAVEHAIDLQMRSVVFKSDSLQLVAAIADGTGISELHGILSDIYFLSQCFDVVSFRFCRCELLCFEDTLAKKALSDFVPSLGPVPAPV